MRCPKCNTEISVKTNYCPECGEKLLKEPIDAAGVSEIDTTSQDRLLSLSRKSKIAIIIGVAVMAIATIILVLFLTVFKHEHNWSGWFIDREPTANEPGQEYRYCVENCGEYEYRSTPSLRTKIENLVKDITDAEKCYTAAKVFYSLAKKDQEEIGAYNLEQAMLTYSNDVRIRDYLFQAKAEEEFNNFHYNLKSKLININSYTVNKQSTEILYDKSKDKYYLYIIVDYSAQNQAGGYTRYQDSARYCVWENNSWNDLTYYYDGAEYVTTVKQIQTYQFDRYATYDFKYSAN